MEEELNYLSEKIEVVEIEIDKAKSELNCHVNSQQANNYYQKKVTSLEKEKQLLNNILAALSINELNK